MVLAVDAESWTIGRGIPDDLWNLLVGVNDGENVSSSLLKLN